MCLVCVHELLADRLMLHSRTITHNYSTDGDVISAALSTVPLVYLLGPKRDDFPFRQMQNTRKLLGVLYHEAPIELVTALKGLLTMRVTPTTVETHHSLSGFDMPGDDLSAQVNMTISRRRS